MPRRRSAIQRRRFRLHGQFNRWLHNKLQVHPDDREYLAKLLAYAADDMRSERYDKWAHDAAMRYTIAEHRYRYRVAQRQAEPEQEPAFYGLDPEDDSETVFADRASVT